MIRCDLQSQSHESHNVLQMSEYRMLCLWCRCVSQMVLARVGNVKSGWKSMFMVFTTAAGDEQPTIVRLDFETIEKIVREHFDFITETEITTFTDCVNCLIAFTNNPHSIDVSLNAIAFLRFCAMKLAEGAIGKLCCMHLALCPEAYCCCCLSCTHLYQAVLQ